MTGYAVQPYTISTLSSQTTLSFVTDGSNRNLLTFAGSGIRLGTLTMYRQTTTMTDTTIAVDLLQTTDVRRYYTTQITFYQYPFAGPIP